MSRVVALVTCRSIPFLEDDDLPLLPALSDLGCDAVPVVWDDPSIRWEAFDATVLRSPVDYVQHRDEFLEWAASIRYLHNSHLTVQWNTSKTYLGDLKGAGVAIVSTQFWHPGEPTLNPPGGPVVIKPAVGVGGEGVRRYGPADQSGALRRVQQLQDDGQIVLVQPYLDSVETVGEVSVVYFDAAYSHAVRRRGFLPKGERTDTDYQPDARQRGLADQVLDYLTNRFGAPLYARIDILEGPSGPVVSEVEATDPVVHLWGKPDRVARFAGAIADRLPS
jgi:hypothetical protein